jgi:hypothetical protein
MCGVLIHAVFGPLSADFRPKSTASGRGGQAAWLLVPVGYYARASCTPGLST